MKDKKIAINHLIHDKADRFEIDSENRFVFRFKQQDFIDLIYDLFALSEQPDPTVRDELVSFKKFIDSFPETGFYVSEFIIDEYLLSTANQPKQSSK